MMKVTGGLIFKDHKLLSARRAQGGPFSGMWEFPGGKIEEGETLQNCIKRELYEELGIKAVIGDLYLNYQYRSGEITYELYFYRVVSFSGYIKMSVHDAIEWVGIDDIEKSKFLPGDGPLIDKLKADKYLWC